MTELFRIAELRRIDSPRAVLTTPLGEIAMSFCAGDETIGQPADESWSPRSDLKVLVWKHAAFRVELLLGRLEPRLPKEMSVSGCSAAVWRIRTTEDISGCRFEAVWIGGHAPAEGGPNSGQGLVAQTWASTESVVSLGTSDAEWLHYYGTGWEMPSAWRELVSDDPQMVVIEEYRPDGISIKLPGLGAAERCQRLPL